MTEITDKELFHVRLRLIDLVKSFFQDEPDAEKMSRWRGTFTALAQEQINPAFDNGVREISSLLKSKNLESLQEEYYTLFTDPFANDQINTMASHYIDGRSFGKTLADFRGFIMAADIVKEKDVVDAEDSLVLMLDVLARLIEEEKDTESLEAREHQTTLLLEYLEPFTAKLSEAVQENEKANFYQSCCTFLNGYLDLEKGLCTVQ
ncbi:MAG: hypothetical protein D6B25_11245 [Desulfobulbaceae bacterium]|nr:MAG: hypothetical protein D6B25_11245 [Desulfobulbaceae bacterium]